MNFGYTKAVEFNPLHTKPSLIYDEVTNFSSKPLNKTIQESLQVAHPLERSEKNYVHNQHQLDMKMLRNVQGSHAALRIGMELKAFQNVGRLPVLSSSNLSNDIILGRDHYIDFDDILHPADMHEQMRRPHITMELSR